MFSWPSTWVRRRDEHGLVMPTRVMVVSISVVALAGLGFVAGLNSGDDPPPAAPAGSISITEHKPTPTAGTTTVAPPSPKSTPKAKPAVRRGKVNVEIYNNSNVTGLAGKTATRAQNAGWTIVSTDNWYGTIDASTVYYAPRLKAAGELLAKDLGIDRVKPAVAPMRFDRLTVILTGDYH
jgi:hypothetical protein